jgi:hypothetical protein
MTGIVLCCSVFKGASYLVSLRHGVCRVKGKAIPVTGRGGAWGCEMLRLPHYLDSLLTDDGKVVSLTRRPPFTSKNILGINF